MFMNILFLELLELTNLELSYSFFLIGYSFVFSVNSELLVYIADKTELTRFVNSKVCQNSHTGQEHDNGCCDELH